MGWGGGRGDEEERRVRSQDVDVAYEVDLLWTLVWSNKEGQGKANA